MSSTPGGDELSSIVGLEGEPFDLIVEQGKIREFARATHARHRSYADDPAPPVPPTFLATAAHWAPHELALLAQIPGEPTRRLHGQQEFVFPRRPPRAGDRLRGRTHVEAAFARQGRRGGRLRFYVLVTEFRGRDDDVVAVSRTTVIETEHAPEGA
jgi:hypothetical protein